MEHHCTFPCALFNSPVVHISIIAAKIVSLKFFFQLQYFSPDSSLARTKTEISIRSVQNADCRLRSLYCFQLFFQFSSRQTQTFSYHTTAQRGIYSISLESSHKLNPTVATFNVQEIDTNLNRNMNEPFDRFVFSTAIHQTGEHSPKKYKTRKILN